MLEEWVQPLWVVLAGWRGRAIVANELHWLIRVGSAGSFRAGTVSSCHRCPVLVAEAGRPWMPRRGKQLAPCSVCQPQTLALADSGLWLEDSQVQLLHSLNPCCYSLGGLKDGVQWGYCTCINLVKNYNGFVKCYVGPLLTSGPLQGSFLSLHWFTVSSTWLTHHLSSPVYISSYCGSWSSSVHHDLLECLRYPGLLDMLGLNGRETFPQETLDSEGLSTGSYCMHCVTKELEAYSV